MAIDALSLLVKVQAEGVKQTEEALRGVSQEGKTSKGHLSGILSTMAAFAGGAAIVNVAGDAFGFLKGQVVDSFQAGMNANAVMAQLTAGLRSTHDASGQTTASLSDLADQITSYSGISDDAVKTGEAMLLTFTGIGKNVFPQATQAAADMATRLNGGAIPSAQQMNQVALLLGKALNDPVKGLTALQREGVTFTDQQKAQIKAMEKAGNTAGAQKVILAELNKEFGGSAKAAGQANGGIGILTAKFADMKEQLGQQLIPVMSKLLGALAPLISMFEAQMPVAMKAVSGFITTTLVPAISRFATWIKTDGVPDIQKLATYFQENLLPPMRQVAAFVTSTLIPAVLAVGKKLADFMGYVATHQDALNAFKAILAGVAVAISVSLVAAFVAWAVAAGAAAIATIAATWPIIAIGVAVAGVIFAVKELVAHWSDISRFFGHIKSAALDVVSKIEHLFVGLQVKAVHWGEDMIKNLAHGITSSIGNITNAVGKIAGAITAHLHFSKPDVGPLAHVDEWMPDMGRMLAAGLDAQRSQVGAAASRVAGALAGGISGSGVGALAGGMSPALLSGGASMAGGGAGSRRAGSGVTQQIVVMLDRRTLTEAVVEGMPDFLRIGTGVRHI